MTLHQFIQRTYSHVITNGRLDEGYASIPWLSSHNSTHYQFTRPNTKSYGLNFSNIQLLEDGNEAPRPEPATILKELSINNVTIVYKGKEIRLPFFGDENYLVKSYTASKDKNNTYKLEGDHPHWIKGELDSTFLLVFAYDINPNSANEVSLRAVPSDAISQNDFMPEPDQSTYAFGDAVKAGERINYEVQPLRVVVMVELLIRKPAFDFEPIGLAKAVSIYPSTYITASDTLDRIEATYHILRPEKSFLNHPNMISQMQAGVWADQNDHLFYANLPWRGALWSNLFSYFKTNMRAFDHQNTRWRVVDPDAQESNQQIKYLWTHESQHSGNYQLFNMKKVDRQGAFDNIHLSPQMSVPYELITPSPFDHFTDMKEVGMAPVCEHDCLHLHWRWMKSMVNIPFIVGGRQFYGWSGDLPFQKPGAPLVPENQTIDLELISSTPLQNTGEGYNYHVTIDRNIQAGKTQYLFHHGMGYIYHTNFALEVLESEVRFENYSPFIKPNLEMIPWGMFYYFLRFAIQTIGDPQTGQYNFHNRERIKLNFEDGIRYAKRGGNWGLGYASR